MLSMNMNDAAARALRVTSGLAALAPADGIAPGLRDRIARGIVRRGPVLTRSDSVGDPAGAPAFFPHLSAWECADSSFHLEDVVPVDDVIVDDAPLISEADQRVLLRQGIAFALEFSRLVHRLGHPAAVRCVVGASETNATFRFHQIRPNESWIRADLDEYRSEKIVVVDIRPAPVRR